MALGVVDVLEAVEVAEDHADRLTGDRGLLRELVDPVRKGLAIEHPCERVDHGLAAMLHVGLHQGGREHRGREDQGEGGHDQGGVVEYGAGVRHEGDGHQQGDRDRHPDDHASQREAGAQGDHGNGKPGEGRDRRPARERHRAGDHHLRAHPGAEHQVLGSLGALELRIGRQEEPGGPRQRNQRPPADPRGSGDQGEGENAHRQPAHGLDALLHIDEALAVEVVSTEPGTRHASKIGPILYTNQRKNPN